MNSRSEVILEVPVPPRTNTRFGTSSSGRPRLYLRKEYKSYQDVVRLACIAGEIRPFTGDVEMEIMWYRESRKGDLPDRWKDLCDALESKKNYGYGPYLDDKQIAKFSVERMDGSQHPRVTVTVRPRSA